MNLNLIWEFNPKKIDDKTVRHNVDVFLKLKNLKNIYVWENNLPSLKGIPEDIKRKISILREPNIYDFLEQNRNNSLLRVKTPILLYPPLIERVISQHQANGDQFTYSDAYDLFINISIEVVSPSILDTLKGKKPYYPDGTLGLPDHVKSSAYLFDYDVQSFYYQDHFDDYYAYPKGLNIEPAVPCNLKCTMCMYHSPLYSQKWFKDKKAYLPFEDFKRMIDEVATYPTPPNIEFVGRGEPLLNKELIKWVQYASSKGVKPFLITNTTLLAPDISDALLDNGLYAMYFSIDAATEATYNKIRPGANYSDVIRNAQYFLDKNSKTRNIFTFIKTVNMPENQHEQADIVKNWVDQVDYVVIQNQMIPPLPENNSKDYKEGYKAWNAPVTFENLKHKRYPCHLLWNNMTITTSGNVANCSTFFEEKESDRLANIKDYSLLDIWRSDELNKRRRLALKRQFDEIPLCKICDGVTCTSLLQKKEITNEGVFVCHYAAQRIFTSPKNQKLYRS
jgi:radical SAM protein with 4Fe4S-binding SPASM domain